MKIKRKVQKNLPQLIEWAMENDIKVRVFESNPNFDGVTYKLGFNKAGDLYFDEALSPTLLFTIEVEEEITEDTVLPKVLNIFKNTTNRIRNDEESHIRRNVSVKEIKENSKDYIENDRLYIMNDDYTMTLIWRDEKMVE